MTGTTMLIAGVDGCPGGWVAIVRKERDGLRLVTASRFEALVAWLVAEGAGMPVVGVDMPIGLAERPGIGGRACDRAARALLGARRGTSVFSAPVRGALRGASYREALALSRETGGVGLTKQCFNILPKILEIDDVLSPDQQEFIREVHPELSFFELNGGMPIGEPKRTREGRAIREQLLADAGWTGMLELAPIGVPGTPDRLRPRIDDVLDAGAACWTANRIARGIALAIPEDSDPEVDPRGLRMEIWR